MRIEKFLSQSPIFMIYRLQNSVLESFQERLQRHEVHLLQALVLTSLHFEGREVRPGEMARAFMVTPSNLSHALRGLEKKDWIKRQSHPVDARGYCFSLTPAGRRKTMGLIKEFDLVQDGMESAIGSRRLKENLAEIQSLIETYQRYFGKSRIR